MAYGVVVVGAGSVTNTGTASLIEGGGGVSIGGVGTVVNAGRILGTSNVAAGIALGVGGSVANQSGATIGGYIGIYGGEFGALTVVNAGIVSGGSYAVQFAAGQADRLVVDPGAVFNGIVDGGNTIGATAVSTLELASGASAGTLTGLGSNYIDFGQVIIDSGADWVLHGSNTLAAGTTLSSDGGTLVVDGSLAETGLINLDPGLLVVGGTAGANGMLTLGAGGTIDLNGATSTSIDLSVGDAAGGSGTVVVSGTGALLDSVAPIAVAFSASATGLLVVSNGGSVFAQTGNSSTEPAVSLADRGTGTLVVTGLGSELTADGVVYDGRAAGSTGTLLIENQGSVVLNADPDNNAAELEVGVGNSSTGTLAGGSGSATVTSGGVLNSGSLIYIGGDGDLPGTLSVTSGTVVGTSTVLGGTVMAARIELGVDTGTTGGGTGVLNIGSGALVETLGTTTTLFTVEIGQAVASSGTATIAGTLIANGQIVVGNSGSTTLAGATGLMTVNTGGTVTAGDGLYIGNNSGATGTVVVDGGALTSAPADGGTFVALGVGSAGSGTLVVEGGGTVTATQISPGGTQTAGPAFDIAINTGGQGMATVTGANSLLQVNGQLNVGDEGNGWLDVNSGAVVNAGTSSVSIGTRPGGNGTVSVESSGTLIGGVLDVNNGVVSVTAGGQVTLISTSTSAASGIGNGFNSGTSGTLIVNGATLSETGEGFNIGGFDTAGSTARRRRRVADDNRRRQLVRRRGQLHRKRHRNSKRRHQRRHLERKRGDRREQWIAGYQQRWRGQRRHQFDLRRQPDPDHRHDIRRERRHADRRLAATRLRFQQQPQRHWPAGGRERRYGQADQHQRGRQQYHHGGRQQQCRGALRRLTRHHLPGCRDWRIA